MALPHFTAKPCFATRGKLMDVSLVLKIVGVGLLTGVGAQLLQKSGKDEQATFVTLAGVVVVMLVLIREIASLFKLIGNIFGL